jgi:hypothetical protein
MKHQPFYKKGFCLGSLAVPGALDIVPLIKVTVNKCINFC